MKKPSNLRLVPIYAMFVVLFALVSVGAAVLMTEKIDEAMIIWLLPLLAIICTVFALSAAAYYSKMKNKVDYAFNMILSAFSDEKAEALKELGGGEPDSQQIMRWVCEQSEKTKRLKDNASVAAAAAELTSEIYWRISDNETVISCGSYWSDKYGYNDLEKTSDIRTLLSENTKIELETAIAGLKTKSASRFSFVGSLMLTPHKEIKVNVRGCAAALSDEAFSVVGFLQDIQEQTELYARLESARAKESFLLGSETDILYELDVLQNKLYTLNPSVKEEMFGVSDMTDFDKDRRQHWDLIHPDYKEGFIDRFFDQNHLMIMPDHKITYDYRIKNRFGDYIWVQHMAQATLARNGEVLRVVGRISNINEQKAGEYKSRYQVDYDSLTGAYMRFALAERFNEALKTKAPRAVIIFNVNRFRHINNEYGFETGDAVLNKIISILWEHQMGKCLVGRADNDTFILAMMSVSEWYTPQVQIESVFSRFKEPMSLDKKLINISLTAAGSSVSEEKSFDALYAEAEKALAVCKNTENTYENAFCIYSADIEQSFLRLNPL